MYRVFADLLWLSQSKGVGTCSKKFFFKFMILSIHDKESMQKREKEKEKEEKFIR